MMKKHILNIAASIFALAACGSEKTAAPENTVETGESIQYGYLEVPVVGGGIVEGVELSVLDEGIFITGTFPLGVGAPESVEMKECLGLSKSINMVAGEPLPIDYGDTARIFLPLPCGSYSGLSLAFRLKGADPVIRQFRDSVTYVTFGASTKLDAVKLLESSNLLSFSFEKEFNPNLEDDVVFDISGDTVFARIEYYAGIGSMTASFKVPEGCEVYVGERLQKSGQSVHDFYSPVTYTVVDADGLSKNYTVSVSHFTGMPVMIIDTPDSVEITSRTEWLENVHIRIDGAGKFPDCDLGGDNKIKGRGNATWIKFPKHPYNIKLGKSTSILGMPAGKRWTLIANYRERTRLRNRTTYHIAATILEGLEYTVRNEWAEVILNGKHQGFYLICESIRAGKDRVPVTEFETDDDDNYIGLELDSLTITGGYIFQVDSYYDEPYKFRTKYRNLPIEFKYPNDNVPPEMMAWCKNYLDHIEELFIAGRFEEVYRDWIDLDSFVDFWIMAELAGNNDAGRPGSDYWYKDRGGKLFAGPVWDYDAFTYTHLNYKMNNALWYNYMLKDPIFAARAKEHWDRYRPALAQIPQWIDEEAGRISLTQAYDEYLWVPMVGFDSIMGDEFYTWANALAKMKSIYELRLGLMDRKISEINGL